MDSTQDITAMLAHLDQPEGAGRDEVIAAVYKEIRHLAAGQLRKERANHTLQPTALAHEACIRLLRGSGGWKNREHLFRTAAKVMRQILTDYARGKRAAKRGGQQPVISISEIAEVPASWKTLSLDEIVELDSALEKLRERDPRQCEVVELRFFVGMKEEEIADVLQVSTKTVKRDWEMARVWLHGQLRPKGE